MNTSTYPPSEAIAAGAVAGTDGRSTGRRLRSRATVAGLLALGLTTGGLNAVPAQAINSNPPTGPGNIEVFPARDMIAIDGYADQAGRTATFKVIRGGQTVGSAVGTVGADGFLEVNHPGGVCWGAGTGLQVTPDIKAGDEIRVDFSDGTWDGSQVVDVQATDVVLDKTANSLTINGRYGAGVDMPGTDLAADPGKFGIEIVNPDMRNGSAIGERAIGWPTDVAPRGHTVQGTLTGTDATGGTFSVTYGFQNAADLALANSGAITALGWLASPDPALGVEAQFGLTLNEFYESGGPGMGGCPAAPDQVRTNGPSAYSAKGAGAGSLTVDWQAATPVPGAPAVSGYTVRAVNGEDEVGKRLPATARTTTINGLVPDQIYSVEIAAKSAAGEGAPSIISRIKAAAHVVPTATATTLRKPNADGKYQPLVTNLNGDFGVHLDPAPGILGAEVHYTTDGSTPTLTSRTFVAGADTSIQIRQDTTLRWIVVDSGNVVGPEGKQFYDIVETDAATQPAPTISKVAAAPVSGAVDVTFNRLAEAAAYRVQAYTGTSADVATGVRVGEPVSVLQPVSPDANGALVTEVVRRMPGLTDGTSYKFSVAARYGTVWSTESALSGAVAPSAAADANAGPDQTSLRGRTVTLDGSGSTKALSYAWTQVRPAAVAPATYRDPIVTLTGADTAKPTFVFPTKTSATSDDGTYEFRLVTTHASADGTTTFTRGDNVVITEQRDAVAATRTRWRAGDELVGTGTQENATLKFHSGSLTGPVIATGIVTNGTWRVPGTNTLPTGGVFHVWSDYGYVGTITVRN
jgi:hypothetical protein